MANKRGGYYKICQGEWGSEAVFGLFISNTSDLSCDGDTLSKGVELPFWEKRSQEDKDLYVNNLHSEMKAYGYTEVK